MIAITPAFFTGYLGFQLGSIVGILFSAPSWVRVVWGLLGLTLSVVVAIGVWIVRNPVPSVDLDRNRLRIRGRSLPLSEVNVARVLMNVRTSATGRTTTPTLSGIRIGATGGPQISIALHHGDADADQRVYRERLAEVIRRSDIRYPTSSYDPTGKFARYNFPENLDKEAALALVLGDADPSDPPVAGDEAPNRV